MWEYMKKQHPEYNVCSDLAPIYLGTSFLSPFLLQRVFLATLFSEPLWGHPLDRLWPPRRRPLVRFSSLSEWTQEPFRSKCQKNPGQYFDMRRKGTIWYDMRYTIYDTRNTIYDIRYTIYEIRCTEYVIRITKYDIRYMIYEVRSTTYDIRYTIYDIRNTI